MKYGCSNDINLEYLHESNSSTLNQIELINFDSNASIVSSHTFNNYDLTSSSFDSEDSRLSDMTYVDRAVHEIMENSNNSSCNTNVMTCIINFLYEQMSNLKNEITYLKAESKVKNSTIDRLFNEIAELRKAKAHNLESSLDLSAIIKDLALDNDTQYSNCENRNPIPTVTDTREIKTSPNTYTGRSHRVHRNKMSDQLTAVRQDYHNDFLKGTSSKRVHYEPSVNNQQRDSGVDQFPPGTMVLVGDSMINQITNKGLSGQGRNVYVVSRSGARITDIKYELMKIIPKVPSHIILHVATNNATTDSSRQICDDLLFLKFLINDKLPSCKVSISCPTMRLDNRKANLTLLHLNGHLKSLSIDIIDHSNIKSFHLARKGLHLNDRGVRQFASNIIAHMRGV